MAEVLDRLKAALSARYTIERELGSGGMATVYLAEDLKHHRQVAIKVLRPELAASLGVERCSRAGVSRSTRACSRSTDSNMGERPRSHPHRPTASMRRTDTTGIESVSGVRQPPLSCSWTDRPGPDRLHVTHGTEDRVAGSGKRESSRDKVRAHRARLRRQGLRPIQIWVPDVRSPGFRAEAHRQSLAVAQSAHEADDQQFIDGVSDPELV